MQFYSFYEFKSRVGSGSILRNNALTNFPKKNRDILKYLKRYGGSHPVAAIRYTRIVIYKMEPVRKTSSIITSLILNNFFIPKKNRYSKIPITIEAPTVYNNAFKLPKLIKLTKSTGSIRLHLDKMY